MKEKHLKEKDELMNEIKGLYRTINQEKNSKEEIIFKFHKEKEEML